MKKKILPRILILLTAATLLSAVIMSSIFAKYVTSSDPNGTVSVRPASFNVDFDAPDMDTIYANFAVDGGGVQLGTTVKRIPYKVTVTSTDSEAAANVTIKLSFNSAMTALITKARDYRYYYEGSLNGSSDTRTSCDFEVYKLDGTNKTLLLGTETTANGALTWTSTTQSILDIGATNENVNEYVIEFLVYHDDNTLNPQNSFDKAEFVSDAVTIDVIATQVDPMKGELNNYED